MKNSAVIIFLVLIFPVVQGFSQDENSLSAFLGIKSYGETSAEAVMAEELFCSSFAGIAGQEVLFGETLVSSSESVREQKDDLNDFALMEKIHLEAGVELFYFGTINRVAGKFILEIVRFDIGSRTITDRSRRIFLESEELKEVIPVMVEELTGEIPGTVMDDTMLTEDVSSQTVVDLPGGEDEQGEIEIVAAKKKKWMLSFDGGVMFGLPVNGTVENPNEELPLEFDNVIAMTQFGLYYNFFGSIYLGIDSGIAVYSGGSISYPIPMFSVVFDSKNMKNSHRISGIYLPFVEDKLAGTYSVAYFISFNQFEIGILGLYCPGSCGYYLCPQIGYTLRF